MLKREDLGKLERFLDGASRTNFGAYSLFENISSGLVFKADPVGLCDAVRAFVRTEKGLIWESDIESIVYHLSRERDIEGLREVANVFERYDEVDNSLCAAIQIYRRIGDKNREETAKERVFLKRIQRINESVKRLREKFDEGELLRVGNDMREIVGLASADPRKQLTISDACEKIDNLGRGYMARMDYRRAFEIFKAGGRITTVEKALMPAVSKVKGYGLLSEIAHWLSEVRKHLE